MRVNICASDDANTMTRLLASIHELGGRSDADVWELGTGLHRFALPEGEVTVFVDTWVVDLEGPDDVLRRVQERMTAGC
jgi:hypothetical protein